METDGHIRFHTNFISFFFPLFFFIITSFAQQQPQVDNEMHVADRREPDKALLGMESLSMTLLPAPHPARGTVTPAVAGGAHPAQRTAGVLSPGVTAQPCAHTVLFQPSPAATGQGVPPGAHSCVSRLRTLVLSISERFRDVEASALPRSPWEGSICVPLSEGVGN